MKKIELKAKIKVALAQAVEYLALAKIIFICSCISFVFSALDVYLDEKIYEELTLAFFYNNYAVSANSKMPVRKLYGCLFLSLSPAGKITLGTVKINIIIPASMHFCKLQKHLAQSLL